MTTIHTINTIISDPSIRSGKLIIAGTRICVIDLVASHLYRGQSPEELAINFALDLGQVYAALAYYHQHKAEIDAQMRADAENTEYWLAELEKQGKLTRLE